MERKKRRRGAAKTQPPAPPTTTAAAAAAAAGPPKRVYGLAISLDDLRAQKDDSEDEDEGDDDDAHDALAHTLPPVDTEVRLRLGSSLPPFDRCLIPDASRW
jgi:hypothetical protein